MNLKSFWILVSLSLVYQYLRVETSILNDVSSNLSYKNEEVLNDQEMDHLDSKSANTHQLELERMKGLRNTSGILKTLDESPGNGYQILRQKDQQTVIEGTKHLLIRSRRQIGNGVLKQKEINLGIETILASSGPVTTIANTYLSHCIVTIFYEQGLESMAVTLRKSIDNLATRIYLITPDTLFQQETWKMSQCDGYIVLLSGKGYFTNHANTDHYFETPYNGSGIHPPHFWNYRARYVVVILPNTDNSLLPFDLVDLYNFKKTENLVILQSSDNYLLVWTNVLYSSSSVIALADTWTEGKFIRGNNLFPDKLNNLKGESLKVGSFEHAPSVIYKVNEDGDILKRLGVDMGIILALSQAKNFSIEFIEISASEKWGTKFENGTWDGLMNRILYEHADIGLCNVFVDHFRWLEVDFSYPYNFMPACFVAPSPKPMNNWQSPILPFAADTWLSIGVALALGGIFVYLISFFGKQPEPVEFRSLAFDYLYILGSLTMQSLHVTPMHHPSRVLIGFVWLFGLIIATAYSANLVAFLSVVRMTKPIDTVEELVDSGLRIGGHSFWKTQFSVAPEQYILDLVDKLESDVNFHTVFNDVEQGEFAFVENQEFLELQRGARFTYGGQASIRLGRQCLINFNIAMILPRNSPLTLSFTTDLMRIYESGIIRKWKEEVVMFVRQQYLNKLSRTLDDARAKPLGLEQLQGVFYLLGFGFLLSLFILIVENIVKRN